MKVSVVIPIYNEEGNIKRVTGNVWNVLTRYGIDSEILLVDDGSTDNSRSEATACITSGSIKLYCHGRNLGKSRSLRTGFDYATGDIIITIDGDGQHDPEYIPRFLDEFDGNISMVSGKRTKRANQWIRNQASSLYNTLLKQGLGLPFNDYNCGYMSLTRECANGIGFTADRIDRYSGLHRYLIPLAVIHGFGVKEIPIEQLPRICGRSKYNIRSLVPAIEDYIMFMSEYSEQLKMIK